MDLILNQIVIVLNTFLITVVHVGMSGSDFKCKDPCSSNMNRAQLFFFFNVFLRVFVGCFLKHCTNINSFLIIKAVFLNAISFDQPTRMFALLWGSVVAGGWYLG